jgi:hypothetical protein
VNDYYFDQKYTKSKIRTNYRYFFLKPTTGQSLFWVKGINQLWAVFLRIINFTVPGASYLSGLTTSQAVDPNPLCRVSMPTILVPATISQDQTWLARYFYHLISMTFVQDVSNS